MHATNDATTTPNRRLKTFTFTNLHDDVSPGYTIVTALWRNSELRNRRFDCIEAEQREIFLKETMLTDNQNNKLLASVCWSITYRGVDPYGIGGTCPQYLWRGTSMVMSTRNILEVMSFRMSTRVTAIVVCCILTQIFYVVSQKSFSFWEDFVPLTPYWGSAPGLHWGPQTPIFMSPNNPVRSTPLPWNVECLLEDEWRRGRHMHWYTWPYCIEKPYISGLLID